MRKAVLTLVAVLATVSVAKAGGGSHTSAGCGLGSIIFDKKEKKVHLILAATTNGSSGNQTFGISTETLGCTSDGLVKAEKRLEVYAEVNFERLSREMAQGGGEYLNALASLMGARDAEARGAFAKLVQSRYERILPSSKTTSSEMLSNLRAELARS